MREKISGVLNFDESNIVFFSLQGIQKGKTKYWYQFEDYQLLKKIIEISKIIYLIYCVYMAEFLRCRCSQVANLKNSPKKSLV